MILGSGAAAIAAVCAGRATVNAKKKKKHKTVTKRFSNTTAVTTPGSGKATPYPSSIQVSGFKKGKIQKIRVFLNAYSAPVPDNIDVMLSATQISGQTAVIMSDVGAAVAVSDIDLILEDDATTSLPDDAVPPLVSGTYKPTNYNGTAESFPSPAPTPSGNSALSVFNGANPNGTWQLWVTDDPGNGPAAFAGGWSIEITAQVKKKKKKKH
jgi:hypothetical protein